MIVSSLGVITDAIEVPDGTAIFDFFRVKVMIGEPGKDGKCIAVEDFPAFPEDGQILWAVAKNNGSYAEITKILVPQQLPFSEDTGETEDDLPY